MFPGGKKGMKDLMKQAQKMQQDLAKAQEELANKVVEGTSGGGMVKVEMNGKHQVLSIKIDPEVVDPDDIEMLEDLIIAALNEAQEKVAQSSENELGKLTGGMKIPGMF
ncbi:MAG: YbaB/EbfC family nucleoid-associated protein [Candidatus Cloacimonetes bacterium]|nr:YbaB/EbfC family nucleoid-associated protein [Candidatus Cloacimonadota bacterium]MCF7812854.1 YbaB/EbfC family nucleoid-associated protein [Candidatus Cloacimonadota bacterium]MCF7867066.1 YbaB/EbfC family nucleoid-associated protein [Candidatus Cloacimonadota bacterium]MCF7882614.1 YbaB/EbfC family nucleoid-associated protein [Candidatus Cloacimonadota bacterium]